MTFKAKFWRSNPQIKNGGYETVRTYEAKTLKQAEKMVEQSIKNTVYGGLEFIEWIDED